MKENKFNHREYYRNLIANYPDGPQYSMRDPFIRASETRFILDQLTKRPVDQFLDLGCGNGHTLEILSREFSGMDLYGCEMLPEQIQILSRKKIPRSHIVQHDLSQGLPFSMGFKAICLQRVLINLKTHRDQVDLLVQVCQKLERGGLLILIESFVAPMVNLNRARKEVGLDSIAPSDQNLYLRYPKLLDKLSRQGMRKLTCEKTENYLSTHFFVTRVIHPLLRPSGGKVEGTHLVNFFVEGMGPGVGEYSPIKMLCFLKK